MATESARGYATVTRRQFGTRLAISLAVASLGPGALAACSSSSSSGGLQLANIYPGYDPVFRQAAKEFEAKYGVSVTVNDLTYTGYEQALKTQIMGGQAPDIMLVEPPALQDFEQAGYLAPIDTELFHPAPGAGGSWGSTFQKGLIDKTTAPDGKHYLVPWNTISVALDYNIRLYTRAGISGAPPDWSSWMADNAAMKRAGIAPFAVSLAGDDASLWWYLERALEAAFRPLTPQINLLHRPGWTYKPGDPSSVAGESYTTDELWVAFKKGLIDPAKSPAYRSVMTAFTRIFPYLNKDAGSTNATVQTPKFPAGACAQSMQPTFLSAALVTQARQAGTDLSLGLANFPTMTQSDVPEMSDGTMNPLTGLRAGFVINKQSEAVADAIKFLKFLTQKDELNKILHLETGSPEGSPAVAGVTDRNASGAVSDTFNPTAKYAELDVYGFGLPPTFDNQDMSEFSSQFLELVEGKMNLDQYLKARSASNEAALQRNLQVYGSSINHAFIKKELGG